MQEEKLQRCQTCLSVRGPKDTKCTGCGVEFAPDKPAKDVAEAVTRDQPRPFRGKDARAPPGKNWVKK